MGKVEVSNIFGWLDEITVKKSHPNSFSEASWDKWNSYMIHRYVSMNMGYIDIVNYVQKTNPQSKKQIYTIYREMIPRKKLWLKYIKNEKKRNYKELAEYIAEYLDCGLGEADHYVDILKKEGCKDILFRMGVEDKEVNKLIKEAKL
tara:strand:- start:404 stop:844 length:441 start_codon:yes stop_codon:yes gene_type:complete